MNRKRIKIQRVNTAVVVDEPIIEPKAGEVLVKMCYSALSAGTERAVLIGQVTESKAVRAGVEPDLTKDMNTCAGGYSGTAIVEKVGEGVTEFKKGDRVLIHGGTHSEYSTVAEKELLHLPDNVDMPEGSMAIIAGFSLAAIRKSQVEFGESCMIVGLGILGLFSVQFARISGAYPVIAVDPNPDRRELALQLGADVALDPTEENYKNMVMSLTDGKGANTVIEVTGRGEALNESLPCTAKFGRVVLLGCTRLPSTVNFYFDVHCPGIQLIGAHSGARPKLESQHGCWTEMDDCAAILKYLSAGRLSFKPIISEIHSPLDAPKVYERLAFDKNFPIGVVFDWNRI